MRIILAYRHVHKICSVNFQLNTWNRGFISQMAFPFPCLVLWRGWREDQTRLVLLTSEPTCGLLRGLGASELHSCVSGKSSGYQVFQGTKEEAAKVHFDPASEFIHPHFHHILLVTRKSAKIQVEGSSVPFLDGRNVT